jgi:MocE subfamily Rieske [2Fe-2S] domain protein
LKPKPSHNRDYSLTGINSVQAIERGLAEASWYQTSIPKEVMKQLLTRRDGPAIRDTLVWFLLLFMCGIAGYLLWGTWWAILPFAVYGILYASVSDSRWHESSHGTAFKTDWMNNVLYEIASFMVLRESTPWRWSHTRHHSDTIIVGRDPEIAVQRPANLPILITNFLNFSALRKYVQGLYLHIQGQLTSDENTYIPPTEIGQIKIRAWIHILIYLGIIFLGLVTKSFLPLMYIGLPSIFGAWLMVVYGYTQHTGLAENVLDHRLNCRTVYMNRINRFLYWNMNYHVEHHMFPLVPYHALPKLHELVGPDSPPAYKNILDAYKEIIPTVLKQSKDPDFFIQRPIPASSQPTEPLPTNISDELEVITTNDFLKNEPGWLVACPSESLKPEQVIRFDHGEQTFAIYRLEDGKVYATDGKCTHSNAHLAEGLVRGCLIECAKHNGRFDVRDGSPQRSPVRVGLKTYPAREVNGLVLIQISKEGENLEN